MVKLLSCITSGNPALLNHFLRHYLSIGIEEMLLIVHSKTADAPCKDMAIQLIENVGLTPSEIWIGRFNTYEKHERMNRLLRSQTGDDDWVVLADLDEFTVFPKQVDKFLAECDENGFFYIPGLLTDRIARNGALPEIQPDEPLERQFPLACRITKTLLGGWISKIAAMKGFLRFSTGHHYLSPEFRHGYYESEYPEPLEVNHYKWDSSLVSRLESRAEEFKQQYLGWYRESERFLLFLKEHGRLDPFHPRVNAVPISQMNDESVG